MGALALCGHALSTLAVRTRLHPCTVLSHATEREAAQRTLLFSLHRLFSGTWRERTSLCVTASPLRHFFWWTIARRGNRMATNPVKPARFASARLPLPLRMEGHRFRQLAACLAQGDRCSGACCALALQQ